VVRRALSWLPHTYQRNIEYEVQVIRERRFFEEERVERVEEYRYEDERRIRLGQYTALCMSELKSVHMTPNSFQSVLYLISSILIIGDHTFSIQNRVQQPEQSGQALSSAFSSALHIYRAKRTEVVAQVIKQKFPDGLPWQMEERKRLEARLEKLVLAHRLGPQDAM